IFIGIQYGVLIGVLLSFGLLLYQSSRPRVMELGRLPNSNVYRNIRRFEEAVVEDSVIILRWDNQLFFANAEYFNSKVLSALRGRRMPPSHMIIDMSNVHDMDTTGLHVLQGLMQVMCSRDIQLLFAGTKGVVRDLFKRSNFYETCPECYHFLRVSDAMAFINQAEGYSWNEGAIQSNS
ncbi:MAG: STAS domain-containing protein, partial [Bacteroidota bacterium]